MNKIILLVATLAVLAVAIDMQPHRRVDNLQHREMRMFNDFINKFNKRYENQQEYMGRFAIFRDNLKKIDVLSNENPEATFGVTKFSDLSAEEFQNYGCGGNMPSNQGPVRTARFNTEVGTPTSWDWTQHGAVTGVKDQGGCGSCWAFSTVGAIEGAWFLAGHTLTGLSEQQFVDCSTSNSGCGGGWPYLAFQDLLANQKGQVDSESGYPYTGEGSNCSFTTANVAATVKKSNVYCNEQTPTCDEDNMASALYTSGPLSACLDATPFQFYTGGIIGNTGCSASNIDHCITLVGYGASSNGTEFWKIKNSWGSDWGEDGFVRLIRGVGACGIDVAVTGAQC